jgi:hypothetical protein
VRPDSRRFALDSIFVNYRRNDSEGEAGRLFDELEKQFGKDSVFMDVAGIGPGQDFRNAIDKSVASCSVLLAVIGPQWVDARAASGGSRLDDPADFVRIELASALLGNIPVVPVLVRGAHVPRPDELPEDLRELAYRNAVELTHARWKSDVEVLIRALRPHMRGAGTESRAPEQPPPAVANAVNTAGGRLDAAPGGGSLDQQSVERLTRELARYLGPIANVIVKRAAQGSASFDDVCAALAREIGSDADRARFLRSCRG